MKKFYLLASMSFFTSVILAQQMFTENASNYMQNFDVISTSSTATLPANWKVSVNETSVRTVDPYMNAGAMTNERAGNNMSSGAAAGIYNFGAGDAATATDRAVGGLSNATDAKSVNIYFALQNSGVADIGGFSISYDVEKYRNGTNAAGFTVTLYYSFDGTLWNEAPSPSKAIFGPGNNNEGFASAPMGVTSVSNQNLNVSIPVNGQLFLAWNYSVATGTITSNAIALALDNVSIIANYPTVLPIKLGEFKVMQKSTAVELGWSAFNESNMDKHEIEKSSNGKIFNVIGTVNAQNNNASKYTYVDAVPLAGYNYYRLKFINNSGEFTYSQVLRINMGLGKTDFIVSPNPVANSTLNLQLNNLTKGKYVMTLINSAGQQVYTSSLNHPGGSSSETISIPSTISRGMYFLQLSDGITRLNKQVKVN